MNPTSAVSVAFDPLLSWEILAGLGVIGVVLIALSLAARARGTFWRLGTLAVVLLALANPSLIEEQRKPIADVALVVVDDSDSMSIGERRTQVQAAREALKRKLTQQEGLEVREAVLPPSHIQLGSERPGGTRLIETMRSALVEVPPERLAGVVLLTDGQVHDVPAIESNKNLLKFSGQPVAFAFGPENGAVSNRLVETAAREANGKNYTHLYVIGFAIDAKARETIEQCEAVFGIPATYVQATPDLLMGDLLKNMRSSQIFSVCGLPEVKVHCVKASGGRKPTEPDRYQVELLGLDVFDPVTMEPTSRDGSDVPCWLLDSDYNGLAFHVSQAFFPRTGAWDNLQRALKGQFDDTVWGHLAGTKSAPFDAGEHKQVAVKVIDDRGNELVVVKQLGS